MLPWRRRHKQALASRTTLQQALVNVAELQGVDKGRVQPPAPAWEARQYVPFLAQQIAQEACPKRHPRRTSVVGMGWLAMPTFWSAMTPPIFLVRHGRMNWSFRRFSQNFAGDGIWR